MKAASAITLLLATVAFASPAPAAQPDAAAVAAPNPVLFESAEDFRNALTERNADAMPKIQLDARKKKPKGGNKTSAAIVVTPSTMLQAGALGLGVMEVVRLWG